MLDKLKKRKSFLPIGRKNHYAGLQRGNLEIKYASGTLSLEFVMIGLVMPPYWLKLTEWIVM